MRIVVLSNYVSARLLVSRIMGVGAVAVLLGCPQPQPPETDGDTIIRPVVGIAPGLRVEIVDIRIPEDRRPEIDFDLLDNRGNPIPLAELTDARFILGFLEDAPEGGTARYVSYTVETDDPDAVSDSGDEFTAVNYDSARLDGITANDDGTLQYKFAQALPAEYRMDLTHQIAGQFRREFVVDGEEYVFNLAEQFRPDGGTEFAMREIVSTQSCNQCHTRLEEHGGVRREMQLCIMCHNQQSFDAETGNSVDFAVMIHKIHRGVDLPSVQAGEPYQLVGFRGTVFDYSDVQFPQDVRNCTVCHQEAAQADFYKTRPTLAGCTSCHDRTWFGNPDQTPEDFADHIGGMHLTDRLCAQCHTPTAPGPSPIDRNHLMPGNSENAEGLSFAIASVRTIPGKQETTRIAIDFTALNRDGDPIDDLSELGIIAATIAYPVIEYEEYVRETISSPFGGPDGDLLNNGGGSFTYTFANDFEISDDTFAVAMEGRRAFEFRDETFEQGTATNALTFFTLDGTTPQHRREIVDEERCNVCHNEIRFHGELRTGVSYCLMCHTANETDGAMRPAEELPPTSVHFKTMIHGIHMGKELTDELTVFGFGGIAHDFTEVGYPAPQNDCTKCHAEGTAVLPVSSSAISTLVVDVDNETLISETFPESASCVSCHDAAPSREHARLNSNLSTGAESCIVCHGQDSAFSVDYIHQLGN